MRRVLLGVGAAALSGGGAACSLLIDWNGYATDGGQRGGSNSGESGAGAGGSHESGAMKESGASVDAAVDTESTDGSVGSDARDDSTGGDGSNGVSDASVVDAPTACQLDACTGCCDPQHINCSYGLSADTCGLGGGVCSDCKSMGKSCSGNGMCTSSSTNVPTCTASDLSQCTRSCSFPGVPLPLPTCCRIDHTCGCKEVFSGFCF